MRVIALVSILVLAGCATTIQEVDSMGMRLTSPDFAHNEMIPATYTCTGEGKSPPLRIADVPPEARSLALVMDDPDAPGRTWDHWLLWNIPANATSIAASSTPAGAVQGKNSWGRSDYGGPCPPSGTHRYVFTLYALDCTLELPQGATKRELQRTMTGHTLAQTQLTGLYRK